MAKKASYHVRNWNEYNRSLIKRGSLTLWFDEDAIARWYETEPTGQRGRTSNVWGYSDRMHVNAKSSISFTLTFDAGASGIDDREVKVTDRVTKLHDGMPTPARAEGGATKI